MKRIFSIIGFSYFIVLMVSIFIPVKIHLICIIILAVLLIFLVVNKKTRKYKEVIISISAIIFAFAVFNFKYNFKILPVMHLANKDLTITATLLDLPVRRNNHYYYVVNVEKINEISKIKNFNLTLMTQNAFEADVYDKITCKIHVFPLLDNCNFNSKIHNYSKEIYVNAFVYDYNFKIFVENNKNKIKPFQYYAIKLRAKMLFVTNVLYKSPISSVINGILLGEKQSIPENFKNNFINAGVYHLFTVSGLHISILLQIFLWLFNKFHAGKQITTICSVVLVLGFMMATCFTFSILRAGIMSLIFLLGILFFKQPDSFNSLGISVFLITLFNPNAAADIGLWLSILANLGITLIPPLFNQNLQNFFEKLKSFRFFKKYKFKLLKYFIRTLITTLSVMVFVFPVDACFFGKISLIGIFSGLILIFPASIVLALSLITNILYLCGMEKIWLLPLVSVNSILINFLTKTTEFLAKLPFASISLDFPYIKLWIAFCLILSAVLIVFDNFLKKFKLLLLLSTNLLFSGIISYKYFMRNILRISVLNANDGSLTVLSKNNHHTVILNDEKNFNFQKISDYLFNINCSKLYCLIILSNNNENFELLQEIIDKYEPKILILPKNIPCKSEKLIYYDKTLKFNFWENIKIDLEKINDKKFLKLKIYDKFIIISPHGGEAANLPKKFKNCDFFIAGGLPNNYNMINTTVTILTMNPQNSKIVYSKLSSKRRRVYSIAQNGEIFIDIDNFGKSTIKMRI